MSAEPVRGMSESSEFDLDRALDALPAEYLECRDWGHSWRPYSATFNRKERMYVQTLECQRCTTKRDRMLGTRGQNLGASYEYADGYLMPGSGYLSTTDRDGIRLRSIMHVLDAADNVKPIRRKR